MKTLGQLFLGVMLSTLVSIPLSSFAQSWEQGVKLESDTIIGFTFQDTPDGGLLAVANISDKTDELFENNSLFIYKVDIDGDLEWSREIEGVSPGPHLTNSYPANDLLYFSTTVETIPTILGIDLQGEWRDTISITRVDEFQPYHLSYHPATGFLVSGRGNNEKAVLFSYDPGQVLDVLKLKWLQDTFPELDNLKITVVHPAANLTFILGGEIDGINGTSGIKIYDMDLESGARLDSTTLDSPEHDEYISDLIEVGNGDVYLTGSRSHSNQDSFPRIYAARLNELGMVIWEETYKGGNGVSIQEGSDGNLHIVGDSINHLSLLKIDIEGNLISDETLAEHESCDVNIFDVKIAPNDEVTLVGDRRCNGGNEMYLARSRDRVAVRNSYISGKICYDTGGDGTVNDEDIPLKQWLVEIKKTGNEADTIYSLTDSLGSFFVAVDPGNYSLTTIQNPYWERKLPQDLFVTAGDTITTDLLLTAATECPFLSVDISTWGLEIGQEGVYYINYCNTGTVIEENPIVEVQLDRFMTPLGSDLAFEILDDNRLQFSLEKLGIGDCGQFKLRTFLDNAAPFGTSHIMEANIAPDSICVSPNEWDGSTISVSGECLGDSIRFTILNSGAAMINPLTYQYIVTVDDILPSIISTKEFELGSGEKLLITYPTQIGDLLYRLEAENHPDHPEKGVASVTIKNCSIDQIEDLAKFPEDDARPSVSIDIQSNGSGLIDGQRKRATPRGFSEEHWLAPNEDIEFHIRFRNEGMDTIRRLVIRDTLSPLLDITQLSMGSSSHPYEVKLVGNNIMKIVFSRIDLPPANVDPQGSKGFVKFRIAQQLNNEEGSLILNTGSIYKDGNSSIKTNQTFHQIKDTLSLKIRLDQVVKIYDPWGETILDWNLYPNPSSGHVSVGFNQEVPGFLNDLEIKVRDMYGRAVIQRKIKNQDTSLNLTSLPDGFYLVELRFSGRSVSKVLILKEN